MSARIPPNSVGLLRCLQALAEEAALLGLSRTEAALQQAIGICQVERPLGVSTASDTHAGLLH